LFLGLWINLREKIQAALDPWEYQIWIEPLRFQFFEQGRLSLGCPNSFHRSWIYDHYLFTMQFFLREVDATVILSLDIILKLVSTLSIGNFRQLELPKVIATPSHFNQRYIFDNFVSGRSNEFAYAAAKAMAQGQRLFSNTLFLVSDTGLGKSHLIQAVGSYVLDQKVDIRVIYLTAEELANQMITAIRNKRMDQFKDRFRRGCDLLLLEEVQFLAGKEKTQEELIFTLDALWDAGGKVIFTGNCPPYQIKGLKQNLLSRLESGIAAPIDPPDLDTRVRILESCAKNEGIKLDCQVLEFLAQELDGDVRRLRSALAGFMAKSSLTGRAMDLILAAEILNQVRRQSKRLTPENIRNLVAQIYGLSIVKLTSKSRHKTIIRPRNLALFLCRHYTDVSYVTLGKLFNRDHSTIMYGVNQIERGLSINPKLAQEVNYLTQHLGIIN